MSLRDPTGEIWIRNIFYIGSGAYACWQTYKQWEKFDAGFQRAQENQSEESKQKENASKDQSNFDANKATDAEKGRYEGAADSAKSGAEMSQGAWEKFMNVLRWK